MDDSNSWREAVELIRQDLKANPKDGRAWLVLTLFRLAVQVRLPRDRAPKWYALPYGILYRVLVEWILGVELPWRLRVGSSLRLLHGQGIVINDEAVLGSQITLRHGVTIGVSTDNGVPPRIGDGVEFGAHAMVLGDVHVGDFSIIGAGAVVTKSVPARGVVVGNPARLL